MNDQKRAELLEIRNRLAAGEVWFVPICMDIDLCMSDLAQGICTKLLMGQEMTRTRGLDALADLAGYSITNAEHIVTTDVEYGGLSQHYSENRTVVARAGNVGEIFIWGLPGGHNGPGNFTTNPYYGDEDVIASIQRCEFNLSELVRCEHLMKLHGHINPIAVREFK